MKRFFKLLGLAIAAIALLTVVRSFATPPLGCSPTGFDNFQAVLGGDKLTADKFNVILCAIRKLQLAILAGGGGGSGGPSICTPITNLAPGGRVLVDVVLPGGINMGGTEPVTASAKDSSGTSRLTDDGIQSCLGSTCKVWVWNRDAIAVHSGSVCVQVRL